MGDCKEMSLEFAIKGFTQVTEYCNKLKYSNDTIHFIDGSGDFVSALNSTIVAKNIRYKYPTDPIILQMHGNFFQLFGQFAKVNECIIYNAKELTNEDRTKLLEYITSKNLKSISFPLLDKVDVEIKYKRPYLFNSEEDGKDLPLVANCALIESTKFNKQFTDFLNIPSFFTDKLNCRQIKFLINNAKIFVGFSRELIILACCDGINTKLVEFNNNIAASYGVDSLKVTSNDMKAAINAINKITGA